MVFYACTTYIYRYLARERTRSNENFPEQWVQTKQNHQILTEFKQSLLKLKDIILGEIFLFNKRCLIILSYYSIQSNLSSPCTEDENHPFFKLVSFFEDYFSNFNSSDLYCLNEMNHDGKKIYVLIKKNIKYNYLEI